MGLREGAALSLKAFESVYCIHPKSMMYGQCDTRLTVTFLASEHHRLSTSSKL